MATTTWRRRSWAHLARPNDHGEHMGTQPTSPSRPLPQFDGASASGADPANAEIPENPVFVEKLEGQNRSQRVRKRLAVRLAEIGWRRSYRSASPERCQPAKP